MKNVRAIARDRAAGHVGPANRSGHAAPAANIVLMNATIPQLLQYVDQMLSGKITTSVECHGIIPDWTPPRGIVFTPQLGKTPVVWGLCTEDMLSPEPTFDIMAMSREQDAQKQTPPA